MDETTIAAPAWLPGDEACARVYNLVMIGTSWAEACAREGISYPLAQTRYRSRGFTSPRRSTPPPKGGWTAAYGRVYDRVLNGETTRDACRAEGVSGQSLRRFLFRTTTQAPAKLMSETRQAIRSQHKKSRRKAKSA